jgi:two-component system, OmpR family, sensor histidine kinase CssS
MDGTFPAAKKGGVSMTKESGGFDQIDQWKNGNHGLGLSIAKRSMEYMGGDIATKASPEGAIFTIILPQDCRSFAVEEWTEV